MCTMVGENPSQPKRGVPCVAAVVILFVVYVLSYAPAVRLYGPTTTIHRTVRITIVNSVDGGQLPVYRPVDFLIDRTPLRRPMLAWAGVWGVR